MDALRPETSLVSVMMVNNEIGVRQPVEEIGKLYCFSNSCVSTVNSGRKPYMKLKEIRHFILVHSSEIYIFFNQVICFV